MCEIHREEQKEYMKVEQYMGNLSSINHLGACQRAEGCYLSKPVSMSPLVSSK